MISPCFSHFRACFAPARADPPCFDAVQEPSVGHPTPTRRRGQKGRNSRFSVFFVDRSSSQAAAGASSSPAADAPAEHRHGSREHDVCFNPFPSHPALFTKFSKRKRRKKSLPNAKRTSFHPFPPQNHRQSRLRIVLSSESPSSSFLLAFAGSFLASRAASQARALRLQRRSCALLRPAIQRAALQPGVRQAPPRREEGQGNRRRAGNRGGRSLPTRCTEWT